MATGYDTDYYAWTQAQAAALRQASALRLNLPGIDLENVAEEIESLGRSDKRALTSQLERLLLHLLKWQYQPGLRGSSWRRSIADARAVIADLTEDSPSLAAVIDGNLDKVYARARGAATDETGLPPSAFPKTCPYGAEQVLINAGLGEVPEE